MIYQEIKSEIEDSLLELNPVIRLIEKIRRTPFKKAYTKKDSEKIDELDIKHSPELVALMLEAKARNRNQKEESEDTLYNPLILSDTFEDSSDIDNFYKYLAGMPDGKIFHYDIIFRPKDIHSTAVQIDSDGENTKILYVDSAKDTNKTERIELEKAIGADYKYNYLLGNIQKASYGCSIFSIQNLNKMSRKHERNDLGYLTSENTSLEALSPEFIKHIQTLKTAQKYLEANQYRDLYIDKEKVKTLKSHLDEFSITLNLDDEIVTRNFSLLYKMQKYLKNSLALLNEIDEDELTRILNKRTGKEILNSVYDEMGIMDLNQREEAQGFYNQYQIRLLLDYQIPKEKLNMSPLFFSRKMSKEAFEYVTHFDNDLEHDEKIRIAQERFELVKNCTNSYQLAAFIDYGQEIDIRNDSIFWIDEETSKAAYECIKKYEQIDHAQVSIAIAILSTADNSPAKYWYYPMEIIEFINSGPSGALHISITMQNIKLIQDCLKSGANINEVIKDTSPLELALKTNNEHVITTVILAGANITQKLVENYSKHFQNDKINQYLNAARVAENHEVEEKIKNLFPAHKRKNPFDLDPNEVIQNAENRYILNNIQNYSNKKSRNWGKL